MPDRTERQSPWSETHEPTEAVDMRALLHLDDPDRPHSLPIALIRRDGGTQARARLDMAIVEEFAQDMQRGDQFPPGLVVYDGQHYWLVRGFTRTAAAESIGWTEYEYIVRQGTQRDAILLSLGENAEHGQRRTNEDKRRAVLTMLNDKEWGDKSTEYIADCCKVSTTMVKNLRSPLTVGSQGEYAEKGSEIRIGKDGREYNVSRIQKKAEKRAAQTRSKSPIRSFVPDGDPVPVDDVDDLPDTRGGMRPALPTGRFGLTAPGFSIPDAAPRYLSEAVIERANANEIVLRASAELHQALTRYWIDSDRKAKIKVTVELIE